MSSYNDSRARIAAHIADTPKPPQPKFSDTDDLTHYMQAAEEGTKRLQKLERIKTYIEAYPRIQDPEEGEELKAAILDIIDAEE